MLKFESGIIRNLLICQGLEVGALACGGGDPMALCGLREIRGWGHFSLLRHLFLCAERKFFATDLRLPFWLKPHMDNLLREVIP